MSDPIKALFEVAITTTIMVGVAFVVVRLMRPLMLDSMGGDTQKSRERMRWLERTTLKVTVGCALLGCVIVLLISGP
jgi:hypothetical protein